MGGRNWTPLGNSDLSLVLTVADGCPSALLTARGKDHDLNPLQLLALARGAEEAVDVIRRDANAWLQTVILYPDPIVAWCIPIAAVVRVGADTDVVCATHLPTAQGLGGSARFSLLMAGLDILENWTPTPPPGRFELPVALGPHFALGRAWVLEHARTMQDARRVATTMFLPTVAEAQKKE